MSNRTVSHGKRLLALLLSLVMVFGLLPAVTLGADDGEGEEPATPTTPSGAPDNKKQLIDNGDGTYTLALSVTGATQSNTVTQVDKANVILVVDTSNSMNQSSGTTTAYTYTEFTGNGTQGSEYWGVDENGDYQRVYWRSNADPHWRLQNNNWSTEYTGTVYTRSGGDTISRIEAEKDALTKKDGIIDKLLEQNVPGDSQKSDIIEVAIVNFGTTGHTASTWSTDGAALKTTVNGLTTSTGTNWESALDIALDLANTKKTAESANGATPDPTYIIFLTDGEPTTDETRPEGTAQGQRHNVNIDYATEWGYASDEAREIITNGYTFYGIFTWGSGNSSHYLSSLVQYAYTGSGNSNSELSSDYAKYFTNATSTEAVIAALQQAINDITTNVGYTNVEMTDAVTEMTTSSVKATASGEVTGIKYYRSGGSYSTTNNGGLGDEWAVKTESNPDGAPPATINDKGEVDWDLDDIILENNVTYTIAFTVWPSQQSLDLVADLNNGIISYDSLKKEQKDQIVVSGGHYSLKTNVDYPTITYSTVTTTTVNGETTTVTSEPTTTTITQPEPVGLTEEKLNAVKEWEDTLDPSQREEVGNSVILYLLVDGEYYYVDPETKKPLGVKLKGEPEEGDDPETFVAWTETDYLAVAPGLMVTSDSPAWPGDNVAGVTYVKWEGKTYAILEEGHDYIWEESEINYHFELTAYHHHPMIMGTVTNDVVFTYAADGKTITGIESVKPMTDNLSATNTLKGGINITKQVVDEDGEPVEDLNPFTVTVTVTDADGKPLPKKTLKDEQGNVIAEDFTIDYRIYYGENNPAYETSGEKHRSDHIFVSGTEFTETLYVGDTIRVVNVEDDSIYSVTETAPAGYEYVGTEYSIAYGTDAPVDLEEGETKTVQGNSASYAVVTNKLTYGTLTVTKTVEGATTDADKAFEFTFKLYEDDTKAKELTGTKYGYAIASSGNTATSSGETADTANTGTIEEGGTFKLKDGETITIDLLPEGAYYEITETEDAVFTTESTGSTGTIVKDTTAAAEFTNTYTAEGEATITVTKALAGAAWPSGKTLTLTLSGEGGTLPKVTEVELTAAGTATFDPITYTEADIGKTYTYTITEDGFGDGWTGSADVKAEVAVTDGGNGTLETKVTYTPENATITNTYKATGSAEIEVNKVLTGRDWLEDEEYTFTLIGSDGKTIEEKTVDEDNLTAKFTPIAYTEADVGKTYNYTVSETSTLLGGISKSGDVTVTVVITDNGDGTLATAVTYGEGEESGTITNTYEASGSVELEAIKKLEGREWQTGETYTFTLKDADGEVVNEQVVDANETVTFEKIKYTQADMVDEDGNYASEVTLTYTIEETSKLPDGITNSGVITVTVTLTDNGDGTITAEPEYTNDDTITNTYEAKGEAVIEVTKALEGAEWPEGKKLTLTLSGEGGTLPETKTVELTAAGKATFGAITYDESDAGKAYTYTITEDGFGEGWTGSGDITATVKVTDKGDGTLTTEVTYSPEDATVTNTYKAKGEVVLEVTKAVEGAEWPEGKTLTLTLSGEGGTLPETKTVELTAAGKATFGAITYDETDAGKTYTYTIEEDGFGEGWIDSGAVTATVKVTDNGDGTLATEVTYTPEDATITNTYVAEGTAVLQVTKALEGAEWPEGKTLTLTLSGEGGTLPETKTVELTAAGKATFGAITYDESDAGKTYTYTIAEDGFGEGWVDTGDITATVKVTDNGDGTLATEVTYSPEDATITNTYVAEGTAVLQVSKALEGAEWPEGKTLTLTLSGEGGTLPETKTVELTAAGKATFGAITYDEADAGKTYTYTITEDGFGEGWTGSGDVTATVKVTDKGDGTLTTEVTYTPEDATVTNTYKAKGEVVLEVTKAVEGAEWPEGKTLKLTLSGEGGTLPETKTVELTAAGKATFGAITYDETDAGKTYTYTITEDGFGEGWTGSGDITATVKVTDKGDGTLTPEVTYSPEDATVTNTYEPETTTLTVTKKWVGDDVKDRPESIDVTLYADGKEVETVTLNEAGKWAYTWEDLPISADGKTIEYTVDEIEVPEGYTKSVSGYTITNTKKTETPPIIPPTPPVKIRVTKVWENDAGNAYGTREAVTVYLLRDGKVFKEVKLSEANNWTFEWTGLEPGFTYTIDEKPVEGYAKTISDPKLIDGNNPYSGKKYTITNTLTNLIDDHVAYIIGYPDGTVRPNRSITRAEVATIFFRLLTDDARDRYWSQTNTYTDVIPEAWYNNAISTLSNMGIINGYEDGTFRPDNPITRAELTKIAVSFFGSASNNFAVSSFTDVNSNAWYSRFIAAAEELGLVKGYGDGTFQPDNPITRAETCAIVNRTLKRAPHKDYLLPGYEMIVWPDNMDTSAWYFADVQEATNSHDYKWIQIPDTVEKWVEKLPERDWAALERVWSTSHSAPGDEVMN